VVAFLEVDVLEGKVARVICRFSVKVGRVQTRWEGDTVGLVCVVEERIPGYPNPSFEKCRVNF